MESDAVAILFYSLSVTLRVFPIVVLIATAIRSVMLLSGLRRSFKTWTRNRPLAIFSMLTAPGMLITVCFRYVFLALMGASIESLRIDTTFMEFSPYVVLKRAPRVAVSAAALSLAMFVSSYIGLLLLFLPLLLESEISVSLVCFYFGISTLLNVAVRRGDVDLLRASLRSDWRRGVIELVAFLALAVVTYSIVAVVIL